MSSYTTQAQVQRYLPATIDTADESTVASLITDASAIVDSHTGRSWPSSPSAVTKRFPCNNSDYIQIGEALTVTAVALVDMNGDSTTLTETDDYWLLPGGSGNAPTAPYIQPIQAVQVAAASAYGPRCYLSVTGTWATANTVPADIAIATARIVAGWCQDVKIGTSRDANVQSEAWDGYKRQLAVSLTETPMQQRLVPKSALEVLDRYRAEGPRGTYVTAV